LLLLLLHPFAGACTPCDLSQYGHKSIDSFCAKQPTMLLLLLLLLLPLLLLPTDACTPFDLSRYGHKSIDSFCAKLNSLSDAQLRELHAQAPLPSSSSGFPLRGCSHRCIAGNSFAAVVAKNPDNNLGWGGKW
jgi:hypothetical protein